MAITEAILERCFNSNPDGAGFCIEIDGQLIIHKGYFSFKTFYEAYLPYENLKALIHFRIKTHGNLDKENCHPFFVNENVAFIHNGIISAVPNHKDKSDTIMFNEHYIQPIVTTFGENALSSPQINSLFGKYIGASKLVFMIKGQEDFIFVNKSMGNLSKEGIWFSNYSWQEPQLPVVQPPHNFKKWKSTPLPFTESIEKSEVPCLEIGNNIFSFGTTVMVKWPINHEFGTIPKGAIGEIEAIYTNKTVDIDFLVEGKINGLYPYALEVLDDYPIDVWDDIPAYKAERHL